MSGFKPRGLRPILRPGERVRVPKWAKGADWWFDGSKPVKREPESNSGKCVPNKKGLWEYYAKFEDDSEVLYSTDCHLTSSRIWATIYFGKQVMEHGMVDMEGVVWTAGGHFAPTPGIRHHEFTQEFSNEWIEKHCPDYSDKADAILDSMWK